MRKSGKSEDRSQKRERDWEEWIASRPECIQKLAREFPAGSVIDVDGTRYHVYGYTENDLLVTSKIDPAVDYDAAIASPVHIHADCVRKHPTLLTSPTSDF